MSTTGHIRALWNLPAAMLITVLIAAVALPVTQAEEEKPKRFKWSWKKGGEDKTAPEKSGDSDYKWSWQKKGEESPGGPSAELAAENAVLKRQINDLKRDLMDLRDELETVRSVAVVAAKNARESDPNAADLKEAELESLRRQLGERTAERDTLKREIERLLDRQDEQVAAIKSVKTEPPAAPEVDVTALEVKIADLEMKNKTLKEELKNLPVASSKELRLALKEREKAEAVLVDVARARQELEKEVLQLKRMTEAKDIALAAQNKELETLKAELGRRESRLILEERVSERIEQTREELGEVNRMEELARLYNLAVAYMERGRVEEAEDEFLSALAIAPENADLHYNLGVLYDDYLDNRRKAALHYKKYLELNPNAEDADQVRGWLFSVQADRR